MIFTMGNTLELDLANALSRDIVHRHDLKVHDQRKPDHYRGPQLMPLSLGASLPGIDETYTAHFNSVAVDQALLDEAWNGRLRRYMRTIVKVDFEECDMRAYIMRPGDHFRMHMDDYLSPVSFVLYLTSRWVWDWGGLFIGVEDFDQARVVMPRFNQLLVMDSRKRPVPHCVTKVEPWALLPRLTISGFPKKGTPC